MVLPPFSDSFAPSRVGFFWTCVVLGVIFWGTAVLEFNPTRRQLNDSRVRCASDDSWRNTTEARAAAASDAHVNFEAMVLAQQTSLPDPKGLAYCERNNAVLDRNADIPEPTPYSITPKTFESFHARPYETIDELLFAVKNGERRWLTASHELLPPIEKEKHQSYFVPAGYDIPPLSSTEMCDIMTSYSHFLLIGDSLTRHTEQAMLMALRGDWILGGIESGNRKARVGAPVAENPYQCRCDGQFSENEWCRRNDGAFYSGTPRDFAVCSHVEERFLNVRLRHWYTRSWAYRALPEDIPWDDVDCGSNDTDYRGIFIYLQPGGHDPNVAEHIANDFLAPILQHPKFQACRAQNKAHLVYAVSCAQSVRLDEPYPHQERYQTQMYNAQVEDRVRSVDASVPVLDWWNLTLDAQVSDGYHYLSDVNIWKAYHIFHLARALRQQF